MTVLGPDNIEGHVDRFEGGVLSGWAWRPDRPQQPVEVEALIDGQVVATAMAVNHREDLGAAGKREGRCAFSLDLGGGLDPQAITLVEVRARDTGEPVPSSPFVIDPGATSPSQEAADPAPAPSFLLGGACGVVGALDGLGPDAVHGWAHWPADPLRRTRLVLYDGDRPVGAFTADRWRPDIAELRQGDGAVGFRFEIPRAMRDGQIHSLDLREADTGLSVLVTPLATLLFPAAAAEAPAQDSPPAKRRKTRWGRPDLSVVIVFYNMRREAERALTALSRAYQHGIDDLNYEVLCIDNGSADPLDADWIAGFGPEFRLFRPSRILASPCFAINEAVAKAKGRRVAVMIDGAHLISPGVLAEAMAAMTETPGSIVALRQWFVGGDQRWLSQAGYSRAIEDTLFAKIDWPADGYRLFQVSSPMFESPNHWFDGASESNCLFLPVELYRALGGYDEAFSEPGAGYANLDLFRRAADVATAVTFLIGEASFHQYHGGTTTNIGDADKDSLVRAFAGTYEALRGGAFVNVTQGQIRLRGQIRTDRALAARQRPMFPGGLGVTRQVRPSELSYLFDSYAQDYLRSTYVECGLHLETRWLGRPVGLAPADLINIQDIMGRVAPDRIVVVDDGTGLASFVEDQRRLLALDDARVIHVCAAQTPSPPGAVDVVHGSPGAAETLAAVKALVGAGERVLVLFEPEPADELPIESAAAYADLVSWGSFFIFLRTALGQPWLGYSRNWRVAAIRRLTNGGGFDIDPSFDNQITTVCPRGYLRRTGGLALASQYDPALDRLEKD